MGLPLMFRRWEYFAERECTNRLTFAEDFSVRHGRVRL